MAAKLVLLTLALAACALAEPWYYGGYGYGAGYGYGYRPYGGVAYHGYGGRSYEYRSPQGLKKRSAEPEPSLGWGYGYAPRVYGYGPGIAAHYGGGRSYTYRSPQGLRYKRSAEPEPGYSFQRVTRYNGYGGISDYAVNTAGYAGAVYDRRRTPYASYGYGFNGGYY